MIGALPMDFFALIAAHAPLTTVIRLKQALNKRDPNSKVRYPSSERLIADGFERLGMVPVGFGKDLFEALFPSERSGGVWLAGEFLLWVIEGLRAGEWSPEPNVRVYASSMINFVEVIARVGKLFGYSPTQPKNTCRIFFMSRKLQFWRIESNRPMLEFFDETFHFGFQKVYYSAHTGLIIRDLRSIWERDYLLTHDYYLDTVDLRQRLDEEELRDEARREREKWQSRGYHFRFKRRQDEE